MRQWHPHNKLLFSTGDVVRHGVAMLASFRAGFEEATGLVFRGGNSPSSGMVAIQIASQLCSSVDIYGFALGNCLGGCPRYHYWRGEDGPERGSASSYKGHQYDVEGWLLKVRAGTSRNLSLAGFGGCSTAYCITEYLGISGQPA